MSFQSLGVPTCVSVCIQIRGGRVKCNTHVNVKISMHLLSTRGKYFQYRIQCIKKRCETAMTRSAFDVLMNAQRELV